MPIKKTSHETNFKVIISIDTFQTWKKYRQFKEGSTEACGILIGRHKIDNMTINLDHATIPSEIDLRTKYSNQIKSKHHQEELDMYFQLSGCTKVYIGTWHSHPQDLPTPSGIDLIDWEKQFRLNEHLFDKMVFVIVGRKQTKLWLIESKNVVTSINRVVWNQ